MPIDSKHPQFTARQVQWQRCRDAVEGTDAVKDAGTLYLPKLSDQTADEYRAYKERGIFVNMSEHILEGMVGMATRREASFTIPEAMIPYFADVTSTGISFHELLKWAVSEVLLQGRICMLVDRWEGDRAYISPYVAENVRNWFIDESTGKLVGVVLQET